jgi:hypothetical protein
MQFLLYSYKDKYEVFFKERRAIAIENQMFE